MKKFIVAAVLAIVLSFSLVVPAYAFTPETIQMLGKHYYTTIPSGFGGGSHDSSDPNIYTLVSREKIIGLYLSCIESCSSSYAFSFAYYPSADRTLIRVNYASSANFSSLGMLSTQSGAIYYCTGQVSLDDSSFLSSIIGYIDQIEGRLARTVDGVTYTVADSTYHTWQTLKDISGYVDQIEGYLVSEDTSTGTKYTIASWVKRVYNAVDQVETYLVSEDDTGTKYTLTSWVKRVYNSLVSTDTGSGTTYTAAGWLRRIHERLGDVISAVNSLTVGVDLSDVQLSVDGSSINFNLNAFCFSPAAGSEFETYAIPYDTATDIVARLNTDYMGQKCTILLRSGGTATGYFRSARINPSGFISAKLTNGGIYYLCDNANVIYVVDTNSNYGSRIDNTLNTVISRLDTIIENQQNSFGLTTCDHQYVSEVSQEPDCSLPGLMIHTCELCDASYSEIMNPLGHDWLCTDHVEAVTDENGEVLESGYDIYTCQRCDQIYYDYDGTGAPDPGHGSTVTDLITAVFTKLGNFVGGLVSAVINLLDKLLTGFDSIVTDFNDRTNQIVNFGGAYPAWLGGIWEIIPSDLQLALGFCVVCLALGIIGKKVVFS